MSELASSLSWALMTVARRQGVVIDSVRLNAAIAAAMKQSGGASIDINSLCAALSLPKAQLLKVPERARYCAATLQPLRLQQGERSGEAGLQE